MIQIENEVCFSNSHLVLTQRGLIPSNEIQVGDELIGIAGEPNKVVNKLLSRNGYKNRKEYPLPTTTSEITIIYKDGIEQEIECYWIPFNSNNYNELNMPSEGYIGTAIRKTNGIGHNVWEQNESEFVWYK